MLIGKAASYSHCSFWNKKVLGTLMFSHKKGVKSTKLLFVGFYSLSLRRSHKELLKHSPITSADL